MPAGDVWGNSWADSWDSSWAQALSISVTTPYPKPAGAPIRERKPYRRRRYLIDDRLYELNEPELAQVLETLHREPEVVKRVKRLPKRVEAKVQQAKRAAADRAQPLAYVPVEALLPELRQRVEPIDEEQITALYELLTGAMELERARQAMRADEELILLAMVIA